VVYTRVNGALHI